MVLFSAEKTHVLNMIRAALECNAEQQCREGSNPDPRVTEELGRTLGNNHNDRFVYMYSGGATVAFSRF